MASTGAGAVARGGCEGGGTDVRAPAHRSPDGARHPHRAATRRTEHRRELAGIRDRRVRGLDARDPALIRVDAIWLCVEPLDMRVGTEAALTRVVNVFGATGPHHAYLFANRRANRMKAV